MTAREKLAVEHPEKLDDLEPGGCLGCPENYGYLPDPDFCENDYDHYSTRFERCKKCWDREIPEEMKEEKEKSMFKRSCEETMCTTCMHQDVCSLKGKFLDAQKAVDGLIVYDELPTGLLGQVKLRDIGFIKPVELVCIHFIPKDTTFIR